VSTVGSEGGGVYLSPNQTGIMDQGAFDLLTILVAVPKDSPTIGHRS
jgi:hypothetical protein